MSDEVNKPGYEKDKVKICGTLSTELNAEIALILGKLVKDQFGALPPNFGLVLAKAVANHESSCVQKRQFRDLILRDMGETDEAAHDDPYSYHVTTGDMYRILDRRLGLENE